MRSQHEKWLGYTEQRIKRDSQEHEEFVRQLESETRAFNGEMKRLKACTSLEELEKIRLEYELANPNVLLSVDPVRSAPGCAQQPPLALAVRFCR